MQCFKDNMSVCKPSVLIVYQVILIGLFPWGTFLMMTSILRGRGSESAGKNDVFTGDGANKTNTFSDRHTSPSKLKETMT